jgi:hypothetical protein
LRKKLGGTAVFWERAFDEKVICSAMWRAPSDCFMVNATHELTVVVFQQTYPVLREYDPLLFLKSTYLPVSDILAHLGNAPMSLV